MSYQHGFEGYWFQVSERKINEEELYTLDIAGESAIRSVPLFRQVTEKKYSLITSAETLVRDSSGTNSNKNIFDKLFDDISLNPFEQKRLQYPHSERVNGFDVQFNEDGSILASRVDSETDPSWKKNGEVITKQKKIYV